MAKRTKTTLKHNLPDELLVQTCGNEEDGTWLTAHQTEQDAMGVDDATSGQAGGLVGVYQLVEIIRIELVEPAYKRVKLR